MSWAPTTPEGRAVERLLQRERRNVYSEQILEALQPRDSIKAIEEHERRIKLLELQVAQMSDALVKILAVNKRNKYVSK